MKTQKKSPRALQNEISPPKKTNLQKISIRGITLKKVEIKCLWLFNMHHTIQNL